VTTAQGPHTQHHNGYGPGSAEDATPLLADHLLTRSALHALPDPQPLIGNVLDQGTVALLYGMWATGKSFIALDWASSVATGRPWQSRTTQQCRVLYVAAEGAFGLKGRLDAWERGWHKSIDDGQLDVLPRPVNLTNTADTRNLAALIGWNGYGFVILDTLARCMVGADENSAKDCGQVVDALTRLRQHTPDGRGVILGVHHTGKDGKTLRGSSAFEAGADTVYSVTRDAGVITLEREKRKDGPSNDRHELRLDPIDGTGSATISVHRGGGQTPRAQQLLSTFVHHFGAVGATRAGLEKVANMPHATFARTFHELVKSGELVPDNPNHRRPLFKPAS
jgi:AAA domain